MNHITTRHIVAAAIAAFAISAPLCAQTKYVMQYPEESYSWEGDLARRLAVDFTKTHDQVKTYIQKFIPDVTDEQMAAWEKTGALETRVIDGQKKYFYNAGPNLFRIDPACAKIKAEKNGTALGKSEIESQKNMKVIIKEASAKTGHMAQPKKIKVDYTLTINADAVPDGETIRCWLPLPRTDVARQTDVKLLSTSEKEYKVSPSNYAHSTVYMEKKAEKGKPTVFKETFEYTIRGSWFNLKPEDVKPYNTDDATYKLYTSERNNHIVFTPRLRHLADSLTRGETNPLLKARKMFRWVNDMFPWASAREYSTIENIPEYVVENGHGDCGQVTLLFLTLCRISGIPAHFQSGFMLHPGAEGLHDWGEIYFEGIGWVPVDMSFGIPTYAENADEEYFYLGGMDSWRMIVNNDYGCPLYPTKTFPRSETVDFQRGEVEWRGGNIYFDLWDWDLKVVK